MEEWEADEDWGGWVLGVCLNGWLRCWHLKRLQL